MTGRANLLNAILLAAGIAYFTYALGFGSGYTLRVLSVAGIYALLAIGYQFIFGQAGALALSQGTFMGLGAYVSGILDTHWNIPFGASIAASILVPVLLAFLVAIPVLHLKTHYFALATLIIGQIVLLVATEWESVTGGANGIGGVSGLVMFGQAIRPGWPSLALVWGLVAIGAAIAWQITRGLLGSGFAMMRANEVTARAIGIDTDRLRLMAFLLSAAYAGLAGALYVHTIRVVSPDVLGFPVMVTSLTIAVIGGRLPIAGALLGAVLVIELPEWFRFLRDYYLLAYGVILLLAVILMPEGAVGAAQRLLARWLPAPPPAPPPRRALPAQAAAPASPNLLDITLLEITGLSRRFGGVRALDDVALSLASGEVLGLIGPNGSGKTTLLNVVTGIYRPDAGQVRFAGASITGQTTHAIARAGIARTFQTVSLVEEMDVLDNVAIARAGGALGLRAALATKPRDPALRLAREEAMDLLARLGAAEYALHPAGSLPYGVRRRVEIARTLALRPLLVLLDEPAAGLNETEQADLAERLRAIARPGRGHQGGAHQGVALLVIEHNMPFLAPLADRMVCLDHGRVIASGTPAEVQRHPLVIEAYLGRQAASAP